MSVSLTDITQIILVIKQKVETYHSNNAICQELSRVCLRTLITYTEPDTLITYTVLT